MDSSRVSEATDRQPGPDPHDQAPGEELPTEGAAAGSPPGGRAADSSSPRPQDGSEHAADGSVAPGTAEAPVEEPPAPGPAAQAAAEPEAALETEPAPEAGPAPEPEPEGRAGRGMRAADRAMLKRVTKERDEYLDQLRRTRADFENYRKRMLRQQTEHMERAAETLVEKLLPILDTFEAAIDHGQGYEQVHVTLMTTLEKEGLVRLHPLGKPFDPSEADAVAHEDGDGGPVVTEVLRPGYRWKGRVVRPAMVRVRG